MTNHQAAISELGEECMSKSINILSLDVYQTTPNENVKHLANFLSGLRMLGIRYEINHPQLEGL